MANALWEPDGTQPPPAPRAWEDPLAGLVTGAAYDSEPFQIEYAQPVMPAMPDLDEVRRAVDAVLAEPAAPPPKIPAPRRLQTPMETPGLVPPNPRAGWPRTPSVRQLQGLRPRKQPPPPPPPRRGQMSRTQGFGAGIGAIVVIAIVLIVIVVTLINSLIDTISTLFN